MMLLGSLVNMLAIFAGCFVGVTLGRFIPERFNSAIEKGIALCVFYIGLDGVLAGSDTLVAILSMVLGVILGELLDLDGLVERFGTWLRDRTGNGGDGEFVDAFVSASLTVCVGAMAVVGSIQDALLHDPSVLLAKMALDLVIVMVMAASMGRGCIFAAVPVGLFQGAIELLSGLVRPVMTTAALADLSLVGNMLIFCVGVNLLFDRKIRVANMLPALVVAVAWANLLG